jgi:hypothetical protein
MMSLDLAFLASRKYKTNKFLDDEYGATID